MKAAVDRLAYPIAGQDFSHIVDYLIGCGCGVSDPFMCLADFDSYVYTYEKAVCDYMNREAFSKMSLMNTASSGVFASDNSISKYASEIWHMTPINKTK